VFRIHLRGRSGPTNGGHISGLASPQHNKSQVGSGDAGQCTGQKKTARAGSQRLAVGVQARPGSGTSA